MKPPFKSLLLIRIQCLVSDWNLPLAYSSLAEKLPVYTEAILGVFFETTMVKLSGTDPVTTCQKCSAAEMREAPRPADAPEKVCGLQTALRCRSDKHARSRQALTGRREGGRAGPATWLEKPDDTPGFWGKRY